MNLTLFFDLDFINTKFKKKKINTIYPRNQVKRIAYSAKPLQRQQLQNKYNLNINNN